MIVHALAGLIWAVAACIAVGLLGVVSLGVAVLVAFVRDQRKPKPKPLTLELRGLDGHAIRGELRRLAREEGRRP